MQAYRLCDLSETKAHENFEQVRKNLREYLCVLFGYSHSESPIEQESKNIYRVAFSISFSTGHVDEANSRYVELF